MKKNLPILYFSSVGDIAVGELFHSYIPEREDFSTPDLIACLSHELNAILLQFFIWGQKEPLGAAQILKGQSLRYISYRPKEGMATVAVAVPTEAFLNVTDVERLVFSTNCIKQAVALVSSKLGKKLPRFNFSKFEEVVGRICDNFVASRRDTNTRGGNGV